MELDILHRAVAPEIIEFYGAFTIESCVYYCMEIMDAGSLDTLTGGGVPAKDVKEGRGRRGITGAGTGVEEDRGCDDQGVEVSEGRVADHAQG